MTIVNTADGKSVNYQQRYGDVHSLPGNNVRCVYGDSKGRIWVGTDTGLALFDPQKRSFTKVTDADDRYDDNIYDVCEMADGTLWVATDIGGVKTVEGLSMVSGQWSSLNTRSIVQDEYGNIWVGNHSTGVDFVSAGKQDFHLLDYKDPAGRQTAVSAIAADTEQGVWMATVSELLLYHDGAVKGRWSSLNGIHREYTATTQLMTDHQGGVWLGIDDQGAYRFDKTTKRLTPIPISPEGSDIHCFAEGNDGDNNGRVWIGAEFGVYLYENGRATMQQFVSKTIHSPATSVIETAPQRLFIATLGDGIYTFDLSDNTYRHLSVREGLPSGKVNYTIAGKQGEGAWLATDAGLVNVKDVGTLTGITVYTNDVGNANHILAMQEDTSGRIWMSTSAGVSCFVKSTGKFYNYNQYDTGIAGGFLNAATTMDHEGNIYFGSASGVCWFNPQQMGNGTELSQVRIISCEAYNPVDNNTEIEYLTPDQEGRVTTTYHHNTIRLTFAMRNFAQTDAVDYSYMMKGMDGKWYDIGNDHDVVFRALPPGQYTFILRAKLRNASINDGGNTGGNVNETQMVIVISPPFWRTWAAFTCYALLALLAAVFIVRAYKRKLILRNALELEHRESLQKQQLNEERLRFFTNITHELRTPLTLILGPLDDLMDEQSLPQQTRRKVAMIHKSAERLRNLINEILEFRKAETQNRRLTVARGDIGQFVREICLNYKELNRNDKVTFVCNIADNLPAVWFDSEIISTVMGNFLSNAVKYTEQGTITTTVTADGDTVRIAVADTGYGIAAKALPHIFERYYQVEGSHQASGTGIGLALVKSLAELHEGTVSVESKEGQGSKFTFAILADNSYPNALHKEDAATDDDADESTNDSAGEDNTQAPTLPMLLVVEDNDDIRQYIADTFAEDFQVLEASNGEEGVQMAQEHGPDIIVSDIMMPKMNGIELTRRLKSDIRTSHIPIILLTAKNTDEDKEEGYDSGADSYLTKPFTAKLLSSRVRNLLTARRRLTEMIANASTGVGTGDTAAKTATDSYELQPQSTLSPLDQDFIDRLNQTIEDNIMQKDIDLTFVTGKMAMSHSTFYRKVKALTGMTATEYIRKRRLRYCYQLLQSGDYNVSQAAIMTGFNQMAHFRETFKKEFGILPSEVLTLRKSAADGSAEPGRAEPGR